MADNTELSNRFFEFESLLRRYYARKMVRKGQISSAHRGQGRVLMLLTMQSEVSQKDLAFILGMRPQSVGELLGKLEKNEWIKREASKEDRRVMLVSLTEKGQAEAKKLAEESENSGEIFDIFSEEEQQQFLEFLERMIAKLSEEVGEDPEDRKAFMEKFAGPDFFREGPPLEGHPHFEKRFGPHERKFDSQQENFDTPDSRLHDRHGKDLDPRNFHHGPAFDDGQKSDFKPGHHGHPHKPGQPSSDEWNDF